MSTRKSKLTRTEALKLGRLSHAERAKARRKIQNRRAAQRQRDRKKAKLLAQRRLASATVWCLPPEPEQRYEPTVGEAEEQLKASPRPEPAPQIPRRAVRAEPTSPRTVRGPNRGGESARSWQPAGERNPTRVPLDV